MYRWYEDSRICYAYLHDVPGSSFPTVPDHNRYPNSNGWPEWFSRGWTLQETIAPRDEPRRIHRCESLKKDIPEEERSPIEDDRLGTHHESRHPNLAVPRSGSVFEALLPCRSRSSGPPVAIGLSLWEANYYRYKQPVPVVPERMASAVNTSSLSQLSRHAMQLHIRNR